MFLTRKGIAIFVVIFGATLSIVSVFIYNQLLGKNHSEINRLEKVVLQKEDIIKQVWQNNLALENKKDLLLLMILLNDDKKEFLDTYIKETMNRSGVYLDEIPENPIDTFSLLTYHIGQKSDLFHEQINNTYFEKIDIQEQIHNIKSENEKYIAIALFLQAIGLVFILSKDIAYLK